MKKPKEDIPLHYYERNYLYLGFFLLLTIIFSYFAYMYFVKVHPFAFILAIPAAIFAFQTLWLLLNPCAIIYEDKFEVKRTLFSNKFWYFIDMKKVGELNEKGFDITYNDDEIEKISTFGIRPSHKKEFRDMVNKYVCKSLVEDRED